MSRVKAPAQRAPQSKEAAIALLERFAEASAEIDAVNARANAEIAKAKAEADLAVAPLGAELKEIAKQLKPWWAASIDALTAGKRKSIELGGCTIGYRMTPPKVVFAHGKDDAAVEAALGSVLAAEIVRTKHTLDKPAVLRLLEGEQAAALAELGFSAEQREEFFIDPVARAAELLALAADAEPALR